MGAGCCRAQSEEPAIAFSSVTGGDNDIPSSRSERELSLLDAAERGDDRHIQKLVQAGVDVNVRGTRFLKEGETPLMQAAQEGKTSTCTVLLDRGAEIEARDAFGKTALMLAARAGETSTCTVLLDRGAEIQARNEEGETPLMKAAYWGNTSTLSVLLDRGAEIQARDKDQGQTALHHAVDCDFEIEDNLPVIKVLWERGSNLDLKDTKGKTPLAYAVEMNKTEVMLFLIDKGADVSAINQHKELYNKVIKRGLTQHILDQNADLDFSGAKLSSAKMQKLISIKVVLLGDVCAGKSSLMETLIKGTSSLTNIEDRTVGINVRKYIMQNDLHITFYDFGGHRTYYFLHQLFLTPSALFNLLVDLSTFDKNDLAASIKHWYFSISSHVVCPIILVIGSKADKCSKEKTEENCSFIINALKDIEHEENERLQESLDMKENALRELKEILPGIDESNLQTSMEVCLKKKTKSNEENTRHRIKEIFDKLPGINAGNIMDKRDALKEMIANRPYIHNTVARISCSTMEGIPELIETIKQLIRDRPKQFPVQEVPATWVEMTDVLEKKAKEENVPYLKREEFGAVCQQHQVGKEDDKVRQAASSSGSSNESTPIANEEISLLNYLGITGPVLYYRDKRPLSKLHEFVFIDPNWLLRIFSSFHDHNYLMDGAHPEFKGKKLEQMFEKFRKEGVMAKELLMEMLKRCGVKNDMMNEMIHLLRWFDICHSPDVEVKYTSNYYIFPYLLPDNKSDEAKADEHIPEDMDEFAIELRFNNNTDQSGLFAKIILRMLEILIKPVAWKKGVIGKLRCEDQNLRDTIRVENLLDKDEVVYRFTVRCTEDSAPRMRSNLMVVALYTDFILRQYPRAALSVDWFLLCALCLARGEAVPCMWPADKSVFMNDPEPTKYCDKCKENIPIQNLFPSVTAPKHKVIKKNAVTYVTKQIARRWRDLTYALFETKEQAEDVIERVQQEDPTFHEVCFQIIGIQWRHIYGSKATFELLIECLRKAHRTDLAEYIEELFKKEHIKISDPLPLF